MKRPGTGGEIHRSFFRFMGPKGGRERASDADRIGRKRATLWSPSVARPAAKADGQKAEAHRSSPPGLEPENWSRPISEEEPALVAGGSPAPRREGGGEIAGAASGESPLRPHPNKKRELGRAPGSLFCW